MQHFQELWRVQYTVVPTIKREKQGKIAGHYRRPVRGRSPCLYGPWMTSGEQSTKCTHLKCMQFTIMLGLTMNNAIWLVNRAFVSWCFDVLLYYISLSLYIFKEYIQWSPKLKIWDSKCNLNKAECFSIKKYTEK